MKHAIFIFLSLILSIKTAEAAELKIAKVIKNTPFSSFTALYIEEVESGSVDYGTPSGQAKDDKAMLEAQATLPEAQVTLKKTIEKEVNYLNLPIQILDVAPLLKQSGSSAVPSASDAVLGVSLEISKWNPGSRLKRAFLGVFGVGKVLVGVKGEFFEYKSNQPIVQFYHERYAAWTYASEGPKRLLLNATEDIGKDLATYLREHWYNSGI